MPTETARRACIDGVWQAAQVLECDSAGFVESLTEVTHARHLLTHYEMKHDLFMIGRGCV